MKLDFRKSERSGKSKRVFKRRSHQSSETWDSRLSFDLKKNEPWDYQLQIRHGAIATTLFASGLVLIFSEGGLKHSVKPKNPGDVAAGEVGVSVVWFQWIELVARVKRDDKRVTPGDDASGCL